MTKQPESNGLTVCRGLSISADHRPIFEHVVTMVRAVPEVKSIGGHSDGDALLVALIVHTNDEDVWDHLSDIEFDVSKKHPGLDIAFRECDSFSESEVQFMHDLPPELFDEFASVAS